MGTFSVIYLFILGSSLVLGPVEAGIFSWLNPSKYTSNYGQGNNFETSNNFKEGVSTGNRYVMGDVGDQDVRFSGTNINSGVTIGSRTSGNNWNGVTSYDTDKEYDAAKEKMDRAEEYANKMAAKCSEQSIQRNYRLRDECYAKRDQAYRERDAAREAFYAIRDGNRTPASTTYSFPGSTFTFPITTGTIFTGPTSTSPTATANQGTSGNNWNGVTSYGTTNVNDNGDTYQLKLQSRSVNGVCMEHWEVGLARLEGKMWQPAFDVKCKGNKIRRYVNAYGKVVIGSPDDTFGLFSNTEDSMTVILDGVCTKYQYDDRGNMKSSNKLQKKDCVKLMSKLLNEGNGGYTGSGNYVF